jgi:cytochrome c oxidase subunit II
MMRAAAGTALATLLAGCKGPQDALDFASDQSRAIGDIWHIMLIVCGLMYLLMMALLAWAIWHAKRRPREQGGLTTPPAADGFLHGLLNSWVVLIIVGLFVLAGASFWVDRKLAQTQDPNALQVRITASEWWWEVEYQDADPSHTIITANELHLPVGRAARIELRSNDVIHSFWVPNLNGKTDLIPGRNNYSTITPRRAGLLRGQCAEFCGLEHAQMAMDVTVEDEAAFSRWKAAQLAPAHAPASPRELQGQQVFLSSTCASCHAIAGTDASGRIGPDLTHLASRRTLAAGALPLTPEALAGWIRQPHAAKPGTNMPATNLPPDQLAALVDYLMTLK